MLQEIVGSQGRAKIFKELFTVDRRKFHLRELSRKTLLSAPVLQRELRQLCGLGVVNSRKDGNRMNFSANEEHPLYPVLCSLVQKTAGAEVLLRTAFQDSNASIVFIFGSFAKGTAHADSDIDLFVIGDCGLREVTRRIHPVAGELAQEINPYVITEADFAARKAKNDHFITEIMASPKIFLKGSAHEFETMAG